MITAAICGSISSSLPQVCGKDCSLRQYKEFAAAVCGSSMFTAAGCGSIKSSLPQSAAVYTFYNG